MKLNPRPPPGQTLFSLPRKDTFRHRFGGAFVAYGAISASFFLDIRRKTLRDFVPSPRVAIPALDSGEPAVCQHELRALTPLQKFHRDQ